MDSIVFNTTVIKASSWKRITHSRILSYTLTVFLIHNEIFNSE